MSEVGTGVETVAHTAAVGADVAVVGVVGTIYALGSRGGARTDGPSGGAHTGVAAGVAGATTRGAGAGVAYCCVQAQRRPVYMRLPAHKRIAVAQ